MCRYTRLRRLRLRFPAPRYRNSLTFHFPFIILRRFGHVFRPCVYQVRPYRNSCKKLVHELLSQNFAIENRYLNSYTYTIHLFGRVVLRSLQLVSFETSTPLYTLTRVRHPS